MSSASSPAVTRDVFGCNAAQLVERFGTPLYVYSQKEIESQFNRLDKSLAGLPHTICYAVKANSSFALLRVVKDLGAGFDTVSEGEIRKARKVGAPADKIVFAGVGKTASEIEYALEAGIRMFNVESGEELHCINGVAERLGKKAPVSLRVNPNVDANTHSYLSTGLRTSKFGIPIEEVDEVYQQIGNLAAVELVGLDCHIGSDITDIAPYEEAYRGLFEVAAALAAKGAQIRYLDLGGGLGISYSGQREPLDVTAYGELVSRLAQGTEYEIIVEPGKFLMMEAGVLLTSVLYNKENSGHRFVVVDAGMNDILRPSLYQAYHHIQLVDDSGKAKESEPVKVDVVGPVCESGCYLGKERLLPPVKAGDILAVSDAGAYCFAMASHYNGRRMPAEVLIDRDGQDWLIRMRDRYDDLWRNEVQDASL